MATTVDNPIIPGFHPDPSICRRGTDYWIATSSFEWFPGVPIYHSTDLVHWRLVGNALTRPTQLPLAGIGASGGIWAPTLRFHAGTFYLITTIVGGGGNILLHAHDPAGPWSEPLWIDAEGYDPSLCFDHDGNCYYTKAGKDSAGNHGIVQCRIDITTGALLDPWRRIWGGSGGFGVEGPHLYHIGSWYYLLCAEGATHVGHMVTIARSPQPQGPFISYPRNPVLTHRNDLGRTIQATGHGDLLQAHDGSWWLVCLGIRSHGTLCMAQHLLGRETFLSPLSWDDEGWPVVNNGEGVPDQVLSTLAQEEASPEPSRDDFDAPDLSPHWVFLRNPRRDSYSLTARPGHLQLTGVTSSLETPLSPAMVVRRQEHRDCRFRISLACELRQLGDEAGLCVFLNGSHHQDFGVVLRTQGRQLQLRRRADDMDLISDEQPFEDGTVLLEAWCNPWAIGYFAAKAPASAVEDTAWKRIAKASTKTLTTEFGGGFTGIMLGVYALGSATASIDWIDYGPAERMP